MWSCNTEDIYIGKCEYTQKYEEKLMHAIKLAENIIFIQKWVYIFWIHTAAECILTNIHKQHLVIIVLRTHVYVISKKWAITNISLFTWALTYRLHMPDLEFVYFYELLKHWIYWWILVQKGDIFSLCKTKQNKNIKNSYQNLTARNSDDISGINMTIWFYLKTADSRTRQ